MSFALRCKSKFHQGEGGAVREREDRLGLGFCFYFKKLNNLFIKGIYVIFNEINLCILQLLKKKILLNLTEYANGGIIYTFPIHKWEIETHPINNGRKYNLLYIINKLKYIISV